MSPSKAELTTGSRTTTRDWVRGWVAVLGMLGAAIGALLIFAASVACGCTRPPA